MAKDPGTYRVRDGSPVAFSVALDQRVPVAHAALIDTARSYRGLTTYLELAEHVQAVSGVRTRMLIGYWSGQLLERVAQLTVERDECRSPRSVFIRRDHR